MSDTAGLVLFEAYGWRYAVPVESVVEVLRALTITPLPHAPPIVEGVINLRSAIVPVLDLRARFRLPGKRLEHTDHLIVARAGERLVAIRADRALDLVFLPVEAIQDLAPVLAGTRYVSGVARLPDGLVLIHDLSTFLSEAESEELAEAIAVNGSGGPDT